MRKQVITATTAIMLGIATTATGTIAFGSGGAIAVRNRDKDDAGQLG